MSTPGTEEPLWRQAVNPLSKERLSRLSLGPRHRVTPVPEQLKQKLENPLGGSNPTDSDSRIPLPSASRIVNPSSGLNPSRHPKEITPCHAESGTPTARLSHAQPSSAHPCSSEPPQGSGSWTGYDTCGGEPAHGTLAEGSRVSGSTRNPCQPQDRPSPSFNPSPEGGNGYSPNSVPPQRTVISHDDQPKGLLATKFRTAPGPSPADKPGSALLVPESLGKAFKPKKSNPECGDATRLVVSLSELAQPQDGASLAGPTGLRRGDRGCEGSARQETAQKVSGTKPLQQPSRPTPLQCQGGATWRGSTGGISSKHSEDFPAAEGWKRRRHTIALPQPSRDRLAAFDLLDDVPDLGPPVPGPAPGPASLNQLNASLSTTKLPTTRPVSSSLPSAGGNPVVSRHFAQRSVDPTLLDGGRSASELQRREAGGEWDRPGVCSSRTADACSQKPESCAGPRTSPRGSYERRYLLSRCAKGQFIPPRPAALRTTAGPPPRGRPSDDVDLTPALARDAAASTDSFGTETGPRDGPEGMDDTSGVSLAPSVPLARKQVPSRLGKAGTNCDGSRAPRLKLVEPEARKTAEDSCVELDTGFMQSATGPARTPKHARDTRGPVPATWVRSRDALVKGAQRWAASTAGKPKRRLQRVYEDDNDGRCNSQSQDLDDADLLRDLSNVIQSRGPAPRPTGPHKLQPTRHSSQSATDQDGIQRCEKLCAMESDAVPGARRLDEHATQGGAVGSPPPREPTGSPGPAADAAETVPGEPCDSDDSHPRFGHRAARRPGSSMSPTVPNSESEGGNSPRNSPRNWQEDSPKDPAGGAGECGWPHEAPCDRAPLRRLRRASDVEPAPSGGGTLKSNPFATARVPAGAGVPSLKHVRGSHGPQHPSGDSVPSGAMGLFLHPVRPRVAAHGGVQGRPPAIVLDDPAERDPWSSPRTMDASPIRPSRPPEGPSAAGQTGRGAARMQLCNPYLPDAGAVERPETRASVVNLRAEFQAGRGRVAGCAAVGAPATTAQRRDLVSRREGDACERRDEGCVAAASGFEALGDQGGDDVVDLSASPRRDDGDLEDGAGRQQHDGGQDPWWHLLPDFVPVAALQNGINPRDGSRVFIDYARQFSGAPALRSTRPRSPGGKDAPGQKKRSKKRKSEGDAGQPGTGRWLTQAGRKVYVTAKGVRKTGQDAYRTAMRQSK